MLFLTKYAVPRKIKPKLTTSRVQSNLPTVFIFLRYEEKGYYRVVSVGQPLTAACTAGAVAVYKECSLPLFELSFNQIYDGPRIKVFICDLMVP